MLYRFQTAGLAALALFAFSPPLLAQTVPEARRVDHVDTYHGVRVADPYRWMEEMESEETRAWVAAQDALARQFAAESPARALIRERIAAVFGGTTYSAPVIRGTRQFFFEAGGGLVAPRVLVKNGNDPAQVLLDPMTIDPSGNSRLSGLVPSEDGRYVAYGIGVGGSRWQTWRVRDVETGRDLADRLEGLHAGGSGSLNWSHDGRGFFYERFPTPEEGQQLTQQVLDETLVWHTLGTPQSNDHVLLDPERPETGISAVMTADGRYLVVQVGEAGALENAVHYLDLSAEQGLVPLIEEADASYAFIGSDGDTFWFMTNLNAPKWRVIAVDLARPGRSDWRDLIAERDDAMDATIGAIGIGDKIIAGYRRDAALELRVFETSGRHAFDIELAGGGQTWGFTGRQGDRFAYYRQQSAVDPGTIYRLDLTTGETTVHFNPDLPYDPQQFVTRQVFYESDDGTRIPMFLVHRADLDRDGTHPVFMYGYGAFSWAAAPWFQPKVAVWLQMGGIYALPNIRGGGEYGEEWHEAGIRRNKQRSVDDFLAAGEWLIDEGYTSPDMLVGNGGSASGPLIGAAIVQRPDLFAASIIDFPALDMLRLEEFTGGRAWRSDFGSTADVDDFAALVAYSPVHNVEAGSCYPATMISPGSRDESTVPMHAYKFAAALQHAQSCERPIHLRVSWEAGHSAGKTPDDRMDTWADQLAFLSRVLDLDPVAALAMNEE